jgi:hypothetical protein
MADEKTRSKAQTAPPNEPGGLYFLWWDPRLTEADVRRALKSDNAYRRINYMSYILNDARFEDVWQYLSLADIQENFWRIRWRTAARRERWHKLLTLLGYPPDECADPLAARVLG